MPRPFGKRLGKHIKIIFGIRRANWKGEVTVVWTTEYINGEKVKVKAAFRAYGSFAESIMDHNKLLGEASRYKRVREAQDSREACIAVHECGYATDPKYSNKLISIIEANNLTRYDDEARIPEWARSSWEKAKAKGINDGYGPNNNVTEAQLMVFFDKLGLLG